MRCVESRRAGNEPDHAKLIDAQTSRTTMRREPSDTSPLAFDRRQALRLGAVAAASAIAGAQSVAIAAPAPSRSASEPFGYCLNMSTIRGQELSIVEQLEVAAKAGYQGVEPWLREINVYVEQGGSLGDLRKRIADLGLSVESAIGFANWSVDDEAQRRAGLEEARRDMDIIAQLGGQRIAAPPAGATKAPVDLLRVAQRYRALLELGDAQGVTPQVEIWGSSATLSRLGEAALVAVEAGHPKACILPDIYHIFRGGSAFTGLRLLRGSSMHVFHVNDYPASPAREVMKDEHRVYCGDGVAPLDDIFRTLRDIGFQGMLSLELFNRAYWEQDALEVARTGLEKTRAAVERALA